MQRGRLALHCVETFLELFHPSSEPFNDLVLPVGDVLRLREICVQVTQLGLANGHVMNA